MKKLLPMFVLLFAVTAFGQSLESVPRDFTSRYDKFTDLSQVYSKYFSINRTNESKVMTSRLQMAAWFTYKGQDLSATPDSIYLRFYAQCPSWCFLENRSLVIIAGTERIDGGKAAYKGDVVKGYRPSYSQQSGVSTTESMIFSIPRVDAEKIVKAGTCEFRLGGFEGTLGRTEISAIETLLTLSTKK